MTASALSLLGFVVWTMALALSFISIRAALVVSGKRNPTDFPADEPHEGSAIYKRLIRAHMNCVENLPLYAAVICVALALDVTGLTDPYAYWYLGFRIAQGVVHIIGVNAVLVNMRFGFLLAQYAIIILMIRALVL